MNKSEIDKGPAATGKRREAVASALASNAFEGQFFCKVEMDIVHRYIDGEIDGDTLREELLALPLEEQEPRIAPTAVRLRKPGEPDPQIEKMLATLNSFYRE